ncbi:MAG: hypothetical protein D6696_21120, partial [Acidobacteria bacterium]
MPLGDEERSSGGEDGRSRVGGIESAMSGVLRRAAAGVAGGAAAGLLALALDQLLVIFTLGDAIVVGRRFVAGYVLLAAAAGLLVALGLAAARRRWPATRLVAATLALLYALAGWERLDFTLGPRLAPPLVLAAVAGLLAGYGVWIAVLGRVAGDATAGFTLAACGLAAALAVNRNRVGYALEPAALAADAGIAALVLALALAARRWGGRRIASCAGLAAAAGLGLIAALRWTSPSPSPPPATTPARPHLILICIDTLRQDVFRAVMEETAEGRALAAELGGAAYFDNAVAAAPWTAPSMGTIMTGFYPVEHGFGSVRTRDPSRPLSRLSRRVATLAEQLRRAGYHGEALVANTLLHPASGIDRGFAHYEVIPGPTAKLPLLTVLQRWGLLEPDYYQSAAVLRRRLARRLPAVAGDGRPLFLWLHFMDPHRPLHPHRDLGPDPSAAGLGRERRLYRDEVRYVLREVARSLALLRRYRLLDAAVLILVSDHGEMFPSDGHRVPISRHAERDYGHGHALYDELMHVPLVIRPPGGLPAVRHLEVLVSHADLYPTIGDLLGLRLARRAGERISLAPWLAPDPPTGGPGRRQALLGANSTGPPQRGLRTRTWKLIHYPAGERPDELYDLVADPAEHHDLAASDPDRLAAARARLERAWSTLRPPPED